MSLVTDLPAIFDQFSEARQKGFLTVMDLKERGIPLVGTYCTFMPQEIPMAAGAVVVSLCSTSDETSEEAELAMLSPENFTRLWTRKEAVLKLLGAGFSVSPKNIDLGLEKKKYELFGIKFGFFETEIEQMPFSAAFCRCLLYKISIADLPSYRVSFIILFMTNLALSTLQCHNNMIPGSKV